MRVRGQNGLGIALVLGLLLGCGADPDAVGGDGRPRGPGPRSRAPLPAETETRGAPAAATSIPGRSAEGRVLVVANGDDPVSLELARRYAEARGIPASHVLSPPLPRRERISRSEFESRLVAPLAAWWNERPPEERPDFVLLLKGVPHRIDGTGGLAGDQASVDSELCYLPRFAAGAPVPPETRRRNPYHGRPGAEFPPFRQGAFDLCLVTRLDGYSAEDAWQLVERALAAERVRNRPPRGVFLLDQSGGSGPGDRWLAAAAERVRERGGRVRLDEGRSFVDRADSLAGYASWGSNDGRYRRDLRFGWSPGALATTYVSTSARTFARPPDDWTPGPSDRLDLVFGGSTQSLVADLVASGATGACGQAHEPFLDGCPRPDVLFPAYLEGRTLAEAFYLALEYLSWQSVVLGDPLTAPYAPEAPAHGPSATPPRHAGK